MQSQLAPLRWAPLWKSHACAAVIMARNKDFIPAYGSLGLWSSNLRFGTSCISKAIRRMIRDKIEKYKVKDSVAFLKRCFDLNVRFACSPKGKGAESKNGRRFSRVQHGPGTAMRATPILWAMKQEHVSGRGGSSRSYLAGAVKRRPRTAALNPEPETKIPQMQSDTDHMVLNGGTTGGAGRLEVHYIR